MLRPNRPRVQGHTVRKVPLKLFEDVSVPLMTERRSFLVDNRVDEQKRHVATELSLHVVTFLDALCVLKSL